MASRFPSAPTTRSAIASRRACSSKRASERDTGRGVREPPTSRRRSRSTSSGPTRTSSTRCRAAATPSAWASMRSHWVTAMPMAASPWMPAPTATAAPTVARPRLPHESRPKRRGRPMDAKAEMFGMSDANEVKFCCAAAYGSEWARLLLGDSFHPGGMDLTERLGALLELAPGKRVLDVAAGKGTSAIHLARRFGCAVVGIDYGGANVRAATQAAEAADVAHLVHFAEGDAERLTAADASFDAVICECAFCTFPDKPAAAAEFARVLRRGGRVGLSDLTRAGDIPPDLRGLLAWIACIADAQPLSEYQRSLAEAG